MACDALEGSGAGRPLVCAGHPRDMGQAQGEALRAVIREAVGRAGLPTHRSRWASLRPLVSGPLRGRGAGRELFRHYAHQAERLEGLALAADLPLDSLLSLQLRIGAGTRIGLEIGEAAWIVRESRPVVGFRSLDRTLAWLVPAIAGVNEAGLALIAPLPSASTGGGAAPSMLLVQDCLARFEHLAGALDWCRKRPAEGEQTLGLADASGARGSVVFRGRDRRVEVEGVATTAEELTGELGGAAHGHETDAVAIDPVERRLRVRRVGPGAAERLEVFGFEPLPPSGSGAHAA